jgi:endoglucanase
MSRHLINLTVPRLPARWLAAFALGVLLALAPAHAEDAAIGFRRGIAVAHAMAWAAVEPAPSRSFVFPPFADSAKNLGAELKFLRRAGFDFVRLAVDPGPFLQFQGSRRDRLDELLMDRVKLILSSGLSVIVDFHPSDLHPDYLAAALTRGVDTPLFKDYVRLLVRTADLLERLQSRNVALEIMNEPPVTPARWQPMLEAAYKAIRERAPRLLLVLDGGAEGGIDGLLALGQFSKDPATLLSFHYYDPYQFTHQGASWVDARYLADVPYPATARPLQQSLDASAALIASTDLSPSEKSRAKVDARQRLEDYRRSAFDRGTIAQSFDRVEQWAKDHGVPASRVILGEFSARGQGEHSGGARGAERARWIRDVREEAEAHGFIWTAWVYRGSGGFALVRDEASSELDPAVTQALGLARQ